jgi:hypothetical protein
MDKLPRNQGQEITPGQPLLNAPLEPLPPLQTEGASLTDLDKRQPYGGSGSEPPATPGITNHQPEADKADAMCDKIDHSVNVLALNSTAHMLAANYYYTRYCVLAIASISISSIVAVWGRILPAGMVPMGTLNLECLASHTCHDTAAETCPAPNPPRTPWQSRRSATPRTRSCSG